MNANELKPGDPIDVLEVHRFGLDRWVPAEVVSVEEHSIGALFMGGASVGSFIALERSTENRLWKRA
jgi:hypothetical protein